MTLSGAHPVSFKGRARVLSLDHVTHRLNIKALWKECINRECSCGMQQKRHAQRWVLWLHTIVMRRSANNEEVRIFARYKIKPLSGERYYSWLLYCWERETCHHSVCSQSSSLNAESWYERSNCGQSAPFNCQTMGNELIYERCAFACRYYGVMNWFERGALWGFGCILFHSWIMEPQRQR